MEDQSTNHENISFNYLQEPINRSAELPKNNYANIDLTSQI